MFLRDFSFKTTQHETSWIARHITLIPESLMASKNTKIPIMYTLNSQLTVIGLSRNTAMVSQNKRIKNNDVNTHYILSF